MSQPPKINLLPRWKELPRHCRSGRRYVSLLSRNPFNALPIAIYLWLERFWDKYGEWIEMPFFFLFFVIIVLPGMGISYIIRIIQEFTSYIAIAVDCAPQEIPALRQTLSEQVPPYPCRFDLDPEVPKPPELGFRRGDDLALTIIPELGPSTSTPPPPEISRNLAFSTVRTSQWLLKHLRALQIPAYTYRMLPHNKPEYYLEPPRDFRDNLAAISLSCWRKKY